MDAPEFFAIVRLVALEKNWIQNPQLNQLSEVFYSVDRKEIPDFNANVKHFFSPNQTSCYEAFVVRKFSDRVKAEQYIQWKRPVFPEGYLNQYNTSVEYISVSDSDHCEPEPVILGTRFSQFRIYSIHADIF